MELKAYYLGMTQEERNAYAERAGTTPGYLPQLMNWHRFPKPALMRALAEASNGEVTMEEVIAHFYEPGPRGNGNVSSENGNVAA